jgi:AcrR family transcriptional regulator
MPPETDLSTERKQQIYQAALSCFGRKGFHKTTMDDIVAESGLSKGALYWYFTSKKDLFLSLFEDSMRKFDETWAIVTSSESGSATDKLRAVISLFHTELEELVPFIGILMEAWVLTRHDEEVETLARRYYRSYTDSLTAIIAEGIASGEFAVESPEATTQIILTLFDGVMLAQGTGLATSDWDQLMGAAEALVLNGVRAERIDG